MKKCYCLLMICAVFIITSCSDDEVVYSCDKSVNKWVMEHTKEIQSMKIGEWKSLPLPKKSAAYGVLTQSQRISFWKSKFDDVLALEWSQDEREHILLARNFVMNHQDFFMGRPLADEQQNIVDLFCYEWSEVAMEKFGWGKDTVVAIIASLDDMGDDKTLTRSGFIDEPFNPGAGGNNCNCNVKYDFCGMSEICGRADCNSTPYCGWFLLSECNGMCRY